MARKYFTKGVLGTGDLQIVWSNADLGTGWRRICRKDAIKISNEQKKQIVLDRNTRRSDMLMGTSHPAIESTFILPEGYQMQKTGNGDLKVFLTLASGLVIEGVKMGFPRRQNLQSATADIMHVDSGTEMTGCRITDGCIVELA